MRKFILPRLARALCPAPLARLPRWPATRPPNEPVPCTGADRSGPPDTGLVIRWPALITVPAALLALVWLLPLAVSDIPNRRRSC